LNPAWLPDKVCTPQGFLEPIGASFHGTQSVEAQKIAGAFFRILTQHLPLGQAGKLVHALPQPM
jgi:uncharacterized protein (DUF2267 family)